LLDKADENYPIRASLLAKLRDEGITREHVIQAIKERRVVFHDVSDIIELYIADLLTKEDVLKILKEGIYMPRSAKELLALVEAGVLTKEEAKKMAEEIKRRLTLE